ncbi:MAG: thioredoxin domain-containing protein [Omnitrophica bacterium]|nr:thioredoxin domain-containing protein [Candidatus Omnitrophota bacterium]
MMSFRTKVFICLVTLALHGTSFAGEEKEKHLYTNKLVNSKSPYLLQHAHNPVNWYPWGKEALNRAKMEDKPIFLSIGYSTCHWCHVMEEESFSKPEIAKILNKYFVAIKVDREERRDLDNVYMKAVMNMTGQGGWPLTVFLTPELEPFYGGTYFPPEDKWGRPGLKTVLNSIADKWKNSRDEVLRSGKTLTGILHKQAQSKSKSGFSLGKDNLKKAYTAFASSFDSRYGGFGRAPKFPQGHSLSFLLRYWKRSGKQKSLKMAEKTLSLMARGGIYDHIGGGFHRYSTDAEWRIPHFEKMLYDQAILSRAYTEAYQATGNEEYARIAKEILEYLLRDMAHPEGGFYSAEDADSPLPENPKKKKEGAFYVWKKGEIVSALGKRNAEILNYHFGIKDAGNAPSDPHGEFKGKNIIYVAHDFKETAQHFKETETRIKKVIKASKKKLFAIRSRRPRPPLDDKVLTDWNGLAISSFAFASRVFDEPRYLEAAEESARFILANLIRENGRLMHRYREGDSAIPGMIDDYAFFIYGLFDLYEGTFDPEYIKEAERLTNEMLRLFWDEESGGFFFTAIDAETLLVRTKEIYDGATPSGNSIAALDLIRLGRLTMNTKFEAKAEALFKAFSDKIAQLPSAYTQTLIALDFALGPSKEIIIAGKRKSKDTKKMIRELYKPFIPNKVVAFRPAMEEEAKEASSVIKFLYNQAPLNGKATAYVCKNYVCNFPTTNPQEMLNLINGDVPPSPNSLQLNELDTR